MKPDHPLGESIAARLKEIGMTQAELARRVGVSQQTVSKWIGGESTPRLKRLETLAGVLDMRLRDLIHLATGLDTLEEGGASADDRDSGGAEELPASIAAKAGQLPVEDQEEIEAFIELKLRRHSQRQAK